MRPGAGRGQLGRWQVIAGRRVRIRRAGNLVNVTYGHWDDDREGEWVLPDLVLYSDYNGSLVERANYEEFIETFGEHEGTEWLYVSGGHGTVGLLIRFDADERVPEIGEFFEALNDYPLANEDRHTELEQQVEREAWESYGRDEFRRWLRRVTEQAGWDATVDLLTEAQLDRLWFDALHNGSGEEVTFENQTAVFNFDRAFRNTDVAAEATVLVFNSWGVSLREYLKDVTGAKFDETFDEVSDETMDAFFHYAVERVSLMLTGKPGGFKADPQRPLHTVEILGTALGQLTDEQWAVLLDAMLTEGPAAFEPGGVGRKLALGRR